MKQGPIYLILGMIRIKIRIQDPYHSADRTDLHDTYTRGVILVKEQHIISAQVCSL